MQPEQPQQPQGEPVAAPTQPQPQGQPVAAPTQSQSTGQPQQPAAQPVPQPQQPGAGGGYTPPQPSYTPGAGAGVKPKGTAALVCGILAIPVAWFSPLVAIVLAIVAIVLSRRAVKQTGKNGKTTGGLICGIAGIVCAIISFIIGLVISFNVIGGVLNEQPTSSTSGSYAATELPANLSQDEQACYELGIAKLDQLKNQDPEMVAYLTDKLDKNFEEAIGVTHEEIGTSAEDLARWMLTDFSYTYDGVYANDDGTATLYAELEMHDSFEFMNSFYIAVSDFAYSSEIESMSSEEVAQQIKEYYNQAMEDSNEAMTDYYTAIDFVKQSDGAWAVDEEAWEDELSYMFGLY